MTGSKEGRVKKWLGLLALASLGTACGGSQDTTPAAQAAADAAATAGSGAAVEAAPAPAPPVPQYREVTLPAGTTLRLRLTSAIASDSSRVEDTVRAQLRQAVSIAGATVLPAGTELIGTVTDVERSGRVKGRARVAYRFNALSHAGERYEIRTAPLSHQAQATKSEDATKIAVGAGAGAAIGALLGGGDGAAKGAAIGGAAGTGTVLATRGEEVKIGSGATVTTRLTAPVTIRVRVS